MPTNKHFLLTSCIRITLLCMLLVTIESVFAQDKTIETVDEDTTVYISLPKMATFGDSIGYFLYYIQKESRIPTTLKREKFTRPVFVNIIIEKDGDVVFSNFARGYNEELNSEAKRIIDQMPHWIPAEDSKGNKKRITYILPFWFK